MTIAYQGWMGEKNPKPKKTDEKYTTMEDRLKKAEKNLQNRMKKNK